MELYSSSPALISLPRHRPCLTRRHVSSPRILSSSWKPGLHWPRAAASEETVTTLSQTFEEPPTPKKTAEVKVFPVEETRDGGGQSEAGDFFSNLDVKVNLEETYYLAFYGAGALLALWISSAVVSSIDSIPLFPKLMEVVGLGYTVWFSYRYLIFKENRAELFSKIEDLKERIIGQSDGE
ncbi:hypothetical protein KSP39_PZI003063 [Platanthera zijinensis]|uniref:Cyanobacterial aminoacyl-tRNA synthetase CAAD domain-containing protein n=1 Tax=Platanthera zijinensis TaxID=2320716 RepID=A0AAP0GCZ2_9ASPA